MALANALSPIVGRFGLDPRAGRADNEAWTPDCDNSDAGAPAPLAATFSSGAPYGFASRAGSSSSSSAATSDAVTSGGGGPTLTFDNFFDSTVTAKYKTCITAAEHLIDSLFTPERSVTVSVDFSQLDAGATGYVAKNYWQQVSVTYAQLTGALPTSDVLPASDPSAIDKWHVPTAYGRMLGISTAVPNPAAGKYDDKVVLNTYGTKPWSYGQDVINALTHELSEGILGRIGSLGGSNPSTGSWTTMDLFRYNGSGVYDVSDGRDGLTAYFSSDGGKTLSKSAGLSFHNNYTSPTSTRVGGDSDDWRQTAVFGGTGKGETLSLQQTELNVIGALGWKVSLPQDDMTLTGNWQTPTNWSTGCMPIRPQDVVVGWLFGVTATSSANVTVNSIATLSTGTLVIAGGSTLTATDGTVLNPETTSLAVSGNVGAIEVDSGSTLAIGDAFDNSGTLEVGASATGSGVGTVTLRGTVTLSGAGAVDLGQYANQSFSAGAFSGGGLVNVDDAFFGGGTIDVGAFNNEAKGVFDATQQEGNALVIDSTNISNAGAMNVEAYCEMDLGRSGASGALHNGGAIDIGWDGKSANSDAFLGIAGTLTVTGGGAIAFKGDNAAIFAAASAASLINESTIDAYATGSISGVTFDNYGSTVATGAGVTLTLSTGSQTIGDGGGLLEAQSGATLAIDSAVTTGEIGLISPPPPGGTIEAGAGGRVDLAASVTDGVTGLPSVAGQAVVAAGGDFVVQSGGDVAVPVEIDGATTAHSGGVFDVLSGGALSGAVTFESAGATLALNHTSATVSLAGSGGVVDLNGASVSTTSGGDSFAFAKAFYLDAIAGFASTDTIQLSSTDFASWTALQPHIAQSGANTTITLNALNAITLDGVVASSLTASEFKFV